MNAYCLPGTPVNTFLELSLLKSTKWLPCIYYARFSTEGKRNSCIWEIIKKITSAVREQKSNLMLVTEVGETEVNADLLCVGKRHNNKGLVPGGRLPEMPSVPPERGAGALGTFRWCEAPWRCLRRETLSFYSCHLFLIFQGD